MGRLFCRINYDCLTFWEVLAILEVMQKEMVQVQKNPWGKSRKKVFEKISAKRKKENSSKKFFRLEFNFISQ